MLTIIGFISLLGSSSTFAFDCDESIDFVAGNGERIEQVFNDIAELVKSGQLKSTSEEEVENYLQTQKQLITVIKEQTAESVKEAKSSCSDQ